LNIDGIFIFSDWEYIMSEKKTIDKEALKKLREKRKVWVEKAKKTIQFQSKIIKQIKAQIADDAKTIPEIARATGLKSSQVLLYVSGLKKYGDLVEADKDGDYFKYGGVS
jgi:glucosamine 6-phosphate synthetase-like amidotransferase/phosphosugar isomerase protein